MFQPASNQCFGLAIPRTIQVWLHLVSMEHMFLKDVGHNVVDSCHLQSSRSNVILSFLLWPLTKTPHSCDCYLRLNNVV